MASTVAPSPPKKSFRRKRRGQGVFRGVLIVKKFINVREVNSECSRLTKKVKWSGQFKV
jgi:hypothetical protein